MSIRLILSSVALTALLGAPALGQRSRPAKAAKTFTVDALNPADATAATPSRDESAPQASPAAGSPATQAAPPLAAPAIPESSAVAAPPATAEAPPPAIRSVFTLDTPIQDLVADPGAKAVLDKDLPGMSDDENFDKFKMLSLRSLQPQTGGQLTDAMLMKVASDFDILGGGTGTRALATPLKAGNARRNRDASR